MLKLSKKIKTQILCLFMVFVFVQNAEAETERSSVPLKRKLIHQVVIEGNQIIDKDLILSHIQIKKGHIYNVKKVQEDVQKLFSLGFFDDIKVDIHNQSKGLRISYHFKERILIHEIDFQGNRSIKTEELNKLLFIKPPSFLDKNQLQKSLFAIRNKYKEKAFYGVELSYRIQKALNKKKFKLVISLKENKKLFIKRVSFIGNRKISSNRLKIFMKTKKWNLLSFFDSSGIFQPENVERDRQAIEYYYRDQGYLNARVQKPEIRITQDKKSLYIVFSISEGSRFKVGEILFQGDEVVDSEKMKDLFHLNHKEYFSLSRLQKDIQLIASFYKNKGYALVQVKPLFFPDRIEENKVHIQFQVDPGEAYKIRNIQILGNSNTRDKVLLRRLYIREGDVYNESKKELSQRWIQQLGYFEKVDFKISRIDSSNKELDLTISLKERENTGELQLAGGFNSQTKFFIQGGIKKQNFLGLEQSVSLNVNFNKYQETLIFTYQIPYFLDSKWNFAFDLFNVAQDYLSGLQTLSASPVNFFSSAEYSSYSQLETGFSFSFGRHLTEYSTLFLKYQLKEQNISYDSIYFLRELPFISSVFNFLFTNTDAQSEDSKLNDDVRLFKQKTNLEKLETLSYPRFKDVYNLEEGIGLNSSLALIWEYDKRNDRYYASDGFFINLSGEYAGLGGDFNYTKLSGKFYHYYSPFWKLVVKNRVDFGWIFSNQKSKAPPFTELFLLGGSYNLRGFTLNSQGPRKTSQEAIDYIEKYNLLFKATQIELKEKKNQLKLWENQGGGSQDQIKQLKKEIDSYSDLGSAMEVSKKTSQRLYGGSHMFFYSLELEIPLVESAGIRLATFFDIGEANNGLKFDLTDQLRMDVGFGIRWQSPFGPIRLDLGFPYQPRIEFGEEKSQLQFSFGSQF